MVHEKCYIIKKYNIIFKDEIWTFNKYEIQLNVRRALYPHVLSSSKGKCKKITAIQN